MLLGSLLSGDREGPVSDTFDRPAAAAVQFQVWKMSQSVQSIASSLHEIGAIQFGTFKLKSGLESPIYVDLRRIVSHPKLLSTVAEAMLQKVKSAQVEFDTLCGVPYTALPIATAMSLSTGLPMVMRRCDHDSDALPFSLVPG